MTKLKTASGRAEAKKKAYAISENAAKKVEAADNTKVGATREKNRSEAAKLILEANIQREKAGLIRGSIKR